MFRKKNINRKRAPLEPQEPKPNNFVLSGIAGDIRRKKFKRKSISPKIKKVHLARQIRLSVLGGLGGIVLVLIIYGLTSQTFRVSRESIEIVSEDTFVNTELIRDAVLDDLEGKLIFGVRSAKIFPDIIESQPNISQLTLRFGLPNRLSISAESFLPVFQTTIAEDSYIITSNGVLIPDNGAGADLPSMRIFHQDSLAPYKIVYTNVMDAQMVGKIDELIVKFSELFGRSEVLFDYFPTEGEIHILFAESVRIMLDLNKPLLTQLQLFSTYLEQEGISLSGGLYTYFDIRVLGKIYACPQSQAGQCIVNLRQSYPQLAREAENN